MLDKMIVFDPNTNPSEAYYSKLSKKEKEAVDKFEKNISITANETRSKKAKSNAIRFLIMTQKNIEEINLQDLKDFLRKLKEAKFSDYYNNDVKNFIQRFLKDQYKDWSERFNAFEDIKYDSDPTRKKKIEPEDVLSKEQVEKLIKAEPELIWKTFLIVQYEGALRTGETRSLKWENVDSKDSETYWLTISSKKNRRAKEKERLAPLEQSIFYLDELKKSYAEQKIKTPYVFPSKTDLNAPISSGTTNKWFSRLTKRVLGKPMTNYLLRHSRGEEFHIKVRDNQMSKENAVIVMGHSQKMFDKTYSHPDKKLLKETLKKQILNIEYIAPEKKHALELRIDQQDKKLAEMGQDLLLLNKKLSKVLGKSSYIK
jgi:integrase